MEGYHCGESSQANEEKLDTISAVQINCEQSCLAAFHTFGEPTLNQQRDGTTVRFGVKCMFLDCATHEGIRDTLVRHDTRRRSLHFLFSQY